MSTATAELVLTFRRDGYTKRKARFAEVVDDGASEVMRTIYIAKANHAAMGHPEELQVRIAPVG